MYTRAPTPIAPTIYATPVSTATLFPAQYSASAPSTATPAHAHDESDYFEVRLQDISRAEISPHTFNFRQILQRFFTKLSFFSEGRTTNHFII